MSNLDLTKSYSDLIEDSLRVIKDETSMDSDEAYSDHFTPSGGHWTESEGTYFMFGGTVTGRFVLKVNDKDFKNDYEDMIEECEDEDEDSWMNSVVEHMLISDDVDVPEVLTDIPYYKGMGTGDWSDLYITRSIPFGDGYYLIQFTVEVSSDDDEQKQSWMEEDAAEAAISAYEDRMSEPIDYDGPW